MGCIAKHTIGNEVHTLKKQVSFFVEKQSDSPLKAKKGPSTTLIIVIVVVVIISIIILVVIVIFITKRRQNEHTYAAGQEEARHSRNLGKTTYKDVPQDIGGRREEELDGLNGDGTPNVIYRNQKPKTAPRKNIPQTEL